MIVPNNSITAVPDIDSIAVAITSAVIVPIMYEAYLPLAVCHVTCHVTGHETGHVAGHGTGQVTGHVTGHVTCGQVYWDADRLGTKPVL